MNVREYDLFAVTAHGLADVCAAELTGLGVRGAVTTGGVAWRGTAESMMRANVELRTASRVIARAGEFRARGFAELERRAAKLPWQNFLAPGTRVVLRVTCRKSRLYHEDAVAERVARVLTGTAGVIVQESGAASADEDEGAGDGLVSGTHAGEARACRSADGADTGSADEQLVIVRFMRDVCTISVDSSGALLHQRGYRQALAKAPLRETIAAAMLLVSGWRGDSPLIDPLCGSGTIPIEAVLLARGIAPGVASPDFAPRPFAFQQWPHFDRTILDRVVSAARSRVRGLDGIVLAADRDAGAITAARANAERAGVANDIEFRKAPLESLEPVPGIGHIVTNPPYGVRIGDRRHLRPLYRTLGRVITSRLPGWTLTMLAADESLAAATDLPLVERLSTRNGGINVRLLTGAAAAAHKSGDTV